MTRCDVCGDTLARVDGFILVTKEIVASTRYWRIHLEKYRALVEGLANPQERAERLVANTFPLVASSGWLVCHTCSALFSFDEEKAQHCARLGIERPDAGPADQDAIRTTLIPLLTEMANSPPRQRTPSKKRYYQCPGCGSILQKDPTSMELTALLPNTIGGVTCGTCKTRLNINEIYFGNNDFLCEDGLLDRMIGDPSNAVFNKADWTWNYRGMVARGPTSTGGTDSRSSANPNGRKKWWQVWRRQN